ncbi:MAG: tetratricopeptide repeat-containing sensor histidine kinase [Bacteroidetes bacterium]|nr:tetratricopeptide repeat-containing sensor histidine kinase [Bacteroidota bacterium]
MFSFKNIIRFTSRLIFIIPLLISINVSGQSTDTKNTLSDTDRTGEKNYELTVKLYLDSINSADKSGQEERKADLYLQLGKGHLRAGQYTEAFSCFFKNLEIRHQKNLPDDNNIGNVYAMLGEAYRAISQYENSIEYLNKALTIYFKTESENGKGYVYNRLASVHYEMAVNRYDTAMTLTAEKEAGNSLEISVKTGNKELTVSNYNILGAIHSYLGKTDEARRFLYKGLSISDSLVNYQDAPNILNNIARTYLYDKNYGKAIEIARLSYSKAEKSGIKIYEIEALRVLMGCYSETGEYKKAYESLWMFYNDWNSIFNEKMESDVLNLKKKYDSELENQLKASEKHRNTILITSIAVVLVLIGAGILMRIRGIQKVNKDLEEQRDTIKRQKEDLEKINEMKDRYFSILSHDLRNPLSGINGFAGMLNSGFDGYTDEEKKEYIGYIKESSEVMYGIISKVLTWSRLQSHTIKVHNETFELKTEANNIINLQRPNASKKGIILENHIESGLKVISDKSIMSTVLTNLIDNAVKFTKEGGKISVAAEPDGEHIVISVQDTGIGMTEQAISNIFSKHSLISTRGTNNEKGTGFGLSICIEMLSLIGSRLQIESKLNNGTKFFFALINKT